MDTGKYNKNSSRLMFFIGIQLVGQIDKGMYSPSIYSMHVHWDYF